MDFSVKSDIGELTHTVLTISSIILLIIGTSLIYRPILIPLLIGEKIANATAINWLGVAIILTSIGVRIINIILFLDHYREALREKKENKKLVLSDLVYFTIVLTSIIGFVLVINGIMSASSLLITWGMASLIISTVVFSVQLLWKDIKS